jgi:glycosyltransferase involved in cell wall biosynthesis
MVPRSVSERVFHARRGRHETGDRVRILGVGNARSVIFLRWAWRLVERGHSVFVVSDRFSTRSEDLAGIELFDVRRLELLTRVPGVRRLRFGPALSDLVRQLEIDNIHGHYLLPYAYWASLIDGPPLVVSPWGTDILVDAQRPGRDGRRARRAIGAADFLVVNSQASTNRALGMGADPERIEQIIWYANLDQFGPDRFDPGFRARFGWPEDALVLLSLRNFRPDTNIDVILRAFRRIADQEPRARLVLAATGGPLQPRIEALIDHLRLRPLVVLTSATEEELPALVASSDLLVAMTRSDSTPASLLEAMASGLPAVCARAASVDEWLEHREGGLIVPQRDEERLAAAVLELLAEPELRLRYGEHNRRVVAGRVAPPGRQLERLYQRLLDNGPADGRPAVRGAHTETKQMLTPGARASLLSESQRTSIVR